MGLKMWNVLLVFSLLAIFLIGYVTGFFSLIDVALLLASTLIFFASYVMLTGKDPFTRVPTPLEIEKIKRKRESKETNIKVGLKK